LEKLQYRNVIEMRIIAGAMGLKKRRNDNIHGKENM
jgi:hypothetical protein